MQANSFGDGVMTAKTYAWLMVSATIFFTVYGQLVLKWQVDRAAPMLNASSSRIVGLAWLLTRPWVLSAFASAFVASLCWMQALSKLPLSKAYPFMSLSFIVVTFCSIWLFNDSLNWQKATGLVLVVGGLVAISQG